MPSKRPSITTPSGPSDRPSFLKSTPMLLLKSKPMLLFLSQPWNQFTSYLLLYPVEPPSSASPTNLTTLSFTSTGYYVSGGTTKDGSPSNVCNLCSSGNIATGGKYISLGSRGKRYEGSCTRLMYSDQNSNAQFGGNGDLNYGGLL